MKIKRCGVIAALLMAVAVSVCGLVACNTTQEESDYSLSGENVTFAISDAKADKAKAGDEVTVLYDKEFGYDYVLTVKNGDSAVTVENGKFTMPAGNITATLTKTAILYDIIAPNSVTFESGVENGKVTVESNVAFSLALPVETYATAVKANDTELTEENGKYSFAAKNYLSETSNSIAITVDTNIKVYNLTASGATLKVNDAVATMAKKGDIVEIEYEERFGYEYNVSVKCGENDVTVDGNSFTMPSGSVTVTVTESAIKYAVTATNGVTFIEGVDDENKTSIEQTVKFSVTSERGYRVVSVKVNGNTVLAREGVYSIDVADYIIEGGTATSITVSVETEQIDYTLSTESSVTFKNGDQTVTSAHMGETIEVEYDAVFGYTYTVSVKCGEEDIVFADNKFVMPDGNVVVTLTKTANKYAVQAQDDFLTFTEGVVEAQTTVESVVKFTIKTTSTRGVENVKVNGTVIQAEQGVYAFNAADYLNENSQTISITYDFFNAIQAFSFKGLNATYSEVEVTVEGSDGEYAMLELRNASNQMTDRLYSKISNNTATFDLSGIENIAEKFALAISASGNVASKITVRNNAEINRVNVQDMLKRTEGTIVENGLTLYSGPASVYTDGKMQSLRTRTFDLNMTYDGPDYKYFTVETSILQYCGSGGSNAIFYKIGDVNQHYVVANSVNYGDTTITDANKVVDLWTCREKILSKDTSLTVLAYVFCAGDHPQCATHGEAYSCIGNIIFYGDADLYLGSIRNDNENGLVYVKQDIAYKGEFVGTLQKVEITTDADTVTINVYNSEKALIAENLNVNAENGKAIFDLSQYKLTGVAYVMIKNEVTVTNIDYKTVDEVDIGKYLYAKQEGLETGYNGGIIVSTDVAKTSLTFDEEGRWNVQEGQTQGYAWNWYIVINYTALLKNIDGAMTLKTLSVNKMCTDGGAESVFFIRTGYANQNVFYFDRTNEGKVSSFNDVEVPFDSSIDNGYIAVQCGLGCSNFSSEHNGEYLDFGVFSIKLSYNVTEITAM